MANIRNAIVNIFTSLDFQAILEETIVVIFQIVLSVVLLWIVRLILEKLVSSYFDNTRRFKFKNMARNDTIQRLLLNIIQYTYYFFVAYSVLSILGVPVGTLVAGAGIASLAVGLGAKDLVQDLVNGIFILLEHQYDVGDHVQINGYEGRVASIGVRTTVIRDYDGIHHFIPNGTIQDLSNLSRDSVRIEVDLLVPTDSDFTHYEQVIKQAYQDILSEDEQIEDNTDFIGVFKDTHGRLVYKVRIWVKDPDDLVEVEGRYYRIFATALNAAGHPVPMSELSHVHNLVHLNDHLEESNT